MAERPLGIEHYALPLPKGDEAFRLLVDRTLARIFRPGRIGQCSLRLTTPIKPTRSRRSAHLPDQRHSE
jgi:hypothetical protein